MRSSAVLVFSLVLVVLFCSGCGGGQAVTTTGSNPEIGIRIEASGGAYWEVTPSDLYSLLDAEDFFLLQYDLVNTGQIPGTNLFISSISNNVAQLPPNKSTPIAVYCHAGIRSAQAAKELVEMGYTRVYDLTGGTAAWSDQGYPLIGS